MLGVIAPITPVDMFCWRGLKPSPVFDMYPVLLDMNPVFARYPGLFMYPELAMYPVLPMFPENALPVVNNELSPKVREVLLPMLFICK